jgi:hypothetical protein
MWSGRFFIHSFTLACLLQELALAFLQRLLVKRSVTWTEPRNFDGQHTRKDAHNGD